MARAPTKPREPWHPAEWEVADAGAIQALHRGDASPEQQKRALEWIIHRAASTYEASFYPANARVTDFMEGRRSVGNQVIKLLKLNLGAFRTDGKTKETA
jgi:hypothetical protein